MLVKFNKKQIKALASIRSRAESFFDEYHAEKPHLYPESEREHVVDMFELGILKSIIENGEIFIEV